MAATICWRNAAIVAAGFGLDFDAVGDDVRGLAAVDEADVARAAVAVFFDQAVPAVAHQPGDGQRRDRDGADALLRRHAGVGREPVDFDLQPIAAGGCNGEFLGRAAVPVERQSRLAQQRKLCVLRAVQADFFLHGKKESQRRMRQAPRQDFQRRVQHHGHARAIIGPQARGRIGRSGRRLPF